MKLPATIKMKDKELKTEDLSESGKRILADLLAAEEQLGKHSAMIRFLEIARKELHTMLDKELDSLSS
jgi:hypothetical protein